MSVKPVIDQLFATGVTSQPLLFQVMRVAKRQNNCFVCVLSDGVNTLEAFFDPVTKDILKRYDLNSNPIIKITKYEIKCPVKLQIFVSQLTIETAAAEVIIIEDSVSYSDHLSSRDDLSVHNNELTPSSSPMRCTPIAELNPFQNEWTIKARISFKSDIRKFMTMRGQGQLFNFNLIDSTDEIRVTAFNEQVDQFFNMLEIDQVHMITKAMVVPAKPKFSGLTHAYELRFARNTEVTVCYDTIEVPPTQSFVKLCDISEVSNTTLVDVAGVITAVGPVIELNSNQRDCSRKIITIQDDYNYCIDVTLWNSTAINFSLAVNSNIICRRAKIVDFGARSLSISFSGAWPIPKGKKSK